MGHDVGPTTLGEAAPLDDGQLRFGAFELDLRTGELRQRGALVRLQHQPFKVLVLLASRPGELVTREEIRRSVWGEATFVDFDQGLNFCIKEIRSALGDDADDPRFVETLRGRGYRFVAPVTHATPATGAALAATDAGHLRRGATRRGRTVALLLGLAVAALAAAALVRPRTPARSGGRAMLAVLPFENLTADPEQDYFSDGLTEEMITQLARLAPRRLGVIARTSSMRYKGERRPVREIARDLGVDFVLEGSVRRSGDRVRVTAQLIRAEDQTHLWADTYERRLDDVLALQNEVAERIAQSLAGRLLSGTAMTAPAVSGEAYDAYLKGRYQLGKEAPSALNGAVAHFERAVALDPGYALAHQALAEAYVALGDHLYAPARDVYPKAKAAAERALVLDDTLAEAHVWLGIVKLYYEWDLAGGSGEFDRALALNPGLASAHHYYSDYLSATGRYDEAIASVGRALALDPLSRAVNEDVGWYYYFARRYEESISQFRRTVELEPRRLTAHLMLAHCLVVTGRTSEALAEAAQVMSLDGARAEEIETVLRTGGEEGYRAFLRWLLARRARQEASATSFLFNIHAALGDREQAFAELGRARDERWRYLLVFVGTEPRLDPLRNDPRFLALRRELGLDGGSAEAGATARPGPG